MTKAELEKEVKRLKKSNEDLKQQKEDWGRLMSQLEHQLDTALEDMSEYSPARASLLRRMYDETPKYEEVD